jgi:hypothetical protein
MDYVRGVSSGGNVSSGVEPHKARVPFRAEAVQSLRFATFYAAEYTLHPGLTGTGRYSVVRNGPVK